MLCLLVAALRVWGADTIVLGAAVSQTGKYAREGKFSVDAHAILCGPYLRRQFGRDRTVRGRVREGRRPTPLGRARGEGRAVAAVPASARAFPANEAVRRMV